MFSSITVSFVVVLVLTWGWKILNWVWLKPKKMERYLRQQGITGPPYRLLHGNTKEIGDITGKALMKPMELSHRIAPRVSPFPQHCVEKYGRTYVWWDGPTPVITTIEPDAIKEILANRSGHFPKVKTPSIFKLLVQGLVSYDGEKWAKHKRILNPSFHYQKLKMMFPEIHTSCSELVIKWSGLVSEGACELDVLPDLHHLAADVISRTAFSSSYKEGQRVFELQTEQIGLAMNVFGRSKYIPDFWFWPTRTNRRMRKIHRDVATVLKDMIGRRESAMKAGEANIDDILGSLLESNNKEIKEGGTGLSTHEVIEECKMLYFGGHETSSTLLAWTMIMLSMHQEWQEKARKEVLQVFGSNSPNYEGLNQLNIVTMIFNEVLRLYPPGGAFSKIATKGIKVGDAYLPAGTRVEVPMVIVHHDPILWGEDVDEFNPERFSGGISKATKNEVSFLSFGWGPRLCIGKSMALTEVKLALSMILQNFRFELSPKYVHAPLQFMIVQPQHGAQLILRKL